MNILQFTLEKRRKLLKLRPLSLLTLIVLATACSPAAPQAIADQPLEIPTEAQSPTPTVEPTPTLAPTEIPDPEATFEQLASMDASIGSFIQDEEGNLIYNSPLYNTEVGKNIPVVQQYREVGLDGGREVWIAPEKYPNAPIVVQDLDTGEIRQGPFRYDNDVRRRLTVPASAEYISRNPQLRVFQGTIPLSGTIAEVKDPGYWDVFGISAVLVSDQEEKDGHLVMGAKSYIGDEEDMLAFDFDISLGPITPDAGTWETRYSTYVGEDKRSYSLNGITTNKGNFRGRYSMSSQVLIAGFVNVNSNEPTIASQSFGENAYYSAENNEESTAVLSILKNNGLGEELDASIDYEDLSLYGTVLFVFR